MQQGLKQLPVPVIERSSAGDRKFFLRSLVQAAVNGGVQTRRVPRKTQAKERETKLNTQKLVVLAQCSFRTGVAPGQDKEPHRSRGKLHSNSVAAYPAKSLQVNAGRNALRMKTISPIQRLGRIPVMPFEAESGLAKPSGQVTPSGTRPLPKPAFARRWLGWGRLGYGNGFKLVQTRIR